MIKAARIADRALTALACLSLFLMMLLTLVDVFGRYFFEAPIDGKVELTSMLMVGMIFTAMPIVTVADKHVAVDLLDGLFGAGTGAWLRDMAIMALTAATLGLMVSWLVFRADRLLRYGDVYEFVYREDIPKYPVAYFIAIMVGLTAAAQAVKLALVAALGPGWRGRLHVMTRRAEESGFGA